MPISRTLISTGAGERYIRRLCKHWSHRFEVTFNDQEGDIDFGGGGKCTLDAIPEGLLVRLEATEEDRPELQDVIIDHLQRFCPKNEIFEAVWSDPTD